MTLLAGRQLLWQLAREPRACLHSPEALPAPGRRGKQLKLGWGLPSGTVGQSEQHAGLRADGRREASASSLLLLCKPKETGDALAMELTSPPFHSRHLTHAKTKRPPPRGFLRHLEGLGRVPALKTHQSFNHTQRLS